MGSQPTMLMHLRLQVGFSHQQTIQQKGNPKPLARLDITPTVTLHVDL